MAVNANQYLTALNVLNPIYTLVKIFILLLFQLIIDCLQCQCVYIGFDPIRPIA